MKFGVIGSIAKPTRPEATGGIEVWTSLFLLESIKRGHVFDLYALKESLEIPNQIHLIKIAEKGIDEMKNDESFKTKHPQEYEKASLVDIYFSRVMVLLKEKQKEYDIIINNSLSPLFTVNWNLYQKPLITIGHFAAAEPYASFLEYFPVPPNIFYTFPSLREFKLATWVPEQQKFHIPHGIDTDKIPFIEDGEKLLWFGRLDPAMRKGAPEAITIANKLKKSINVFTHIEDEKYFDSAIKPILTPYTNFQTDRPRSEYFKDAKLFVLPLQWEEPFGLTIVEAMASGTPVIAYARGAVPEIIRDGETGFIVNSSESDQRGNWTIKRTGEEGMFEAIEKIYSLPPERYQAMRHTCREYVKKNFSVEKMVDGYEKAYVTILKKT